jgi:amidophosphoribosyltransferase
MCAVVGVVGQQPVNQLIYDALTGLQHRGQDAAGIATADGHVFHLHKESGLVREVFHTRHMRDLKGNMGIGHCRYPTAGSSVLVAEAQPFYVNSPFGILLSHNGNLTNSAALQGELFATDARHINTQSDSEVLLNVLALELERAAGATRKLTPQLVAQAVNGVHARCRGAYAVIALIAGFGMVAFRDRNGIRPLAFGRSRTSAGPEIMVASESVVLDMLGFTFERDVAPGETIVVTQDGHLQSFALPAAQFARFRPCIFEYVYLARPDSIIDGTSVYDARVRMGAALAPQVLADPRCSDVDVVIPIPDSSRPAALELALTINKPYREGFVKNRYIGRTFIMPGQTQRKKSVRQKLNAQAQEFAGKHVLLVDDSIVRGTTSREIVRMARESGARKVTFASAAPPLRYPNVYGIDMPTQSELIAYGRTVDEICKAIEADALIFQDLEALKTAVRGANPALEDFDSSCFDGKYVTGDIDEQYLATLSSNRNESRDVGQPQRE